MIQTVPIITLQLSVENNKHDKKELTTEYLLLNTMGNNYQIEC